MFFYHVSMFTIIIIIIILFYHMYCLCIYKITPWAWYTALVKYTHAAEHVQQPRLLASPLVALLVRT